jgi:hypothetical protein
MAQLTSCKYLIRGVLIPHYDTKNGTKYLESLLSTIIPFEMELILYGSNNDAFHLELPGFWAPSVVYAF